MPQTSKGLSVGSLISGKLDISASQYLFKNFINAFCPKATTKHNLYKHVAMIYEMDTEATFDSRLYHKTYRYSRKAARGEKADRTAPLPMSLLQLIQRLRILSIDRNVKINCSCFATYQRKKMTRE